MDNTTAGIESISIPAEDVAVEQAFVALEEKLRAYQTAMQNTHAGLSAMVASGPSEADEAIVSGAELCEASTPVASDAVASSPQDADVEVQESASPVAEVEAAGASPAESTVTVKSETAESLDDEQAVQAEASDVVRATPTEPKPPTPEVHGDVVEQPADKVAETESSPDPPEADSVSEDEALLASLDEETAKAIKVMRRMCMDSRSVRELLEEYEAGKAASKQAQPEKKSWFSRGR